MRPISFYIKKGNPMKKISKSTVFIVLLLGTAMVFQQCNDDDENQGVLNIYITDAPFPVDLVAEANVVIDQVRIRSEGEEEEENFITLMDQTFDLNLLELRNGLVGQIASAQLPPGAYDHLRLHVTEAEIILTNGDQYSLNVPSGNSSGLKVIINPAIEVVGGLTSELILDFDVSKSFVLQGNMDTPAGINGFLFKPVIRAANNSATGAVAGKVANQNGSGLYNAKVWLENDTVLTTAFTDSSGQYAILGVPANIYTAFSTKEGFDTSFYDNVEVVPANQSVVNFQLDSMNIE